MKSYKLGDIIKVLDYKRIPLSSKERESRKGIYPYYGAQGIIDYIDDFIFDGDYLLIAEDGENLKSKKMNIAQIAHGKYWVNNHAHIVESNGKCDLRYICYLLNNTDISGYITGSAQPKLNQANLLSIELTLPDLSEQIRIADILSTFDDKIELNNRINHNLEEQAQALFKSWFVDFEPFKEENFEDTEIGRIPKGWNVMLFKSFITASTEKVVVGDLPEYSVTNNGIIPRDQKFNKKLSQSTSKNKVLRHDNLVFGMSRDILNWGIMEDEIGSVSSAYNVYTINQDLIMPKYLRLYMMAKLPYFNDLIGTAAREGQSLDKGALFQKAVYVPPSDICHEFFNIYDRLIEMQQTAILESKQLAYYRDYILPLLLDGVLNVESVNL